MGTSGAYTGAGGKPGKDTGQGLSDWLDSLAGSPDGGDNTPNQDATGSGEKPAAQLPPQAVSGLLARLRPRPTSGGSSDGPGVGGGIDARGGLAGGSGRARGGLRPVVAKAGNPSAVGLRRVLTPTSAGMRFGLLSLGLDYSELRALNDPFEVTRRIVNAVCGEQADGRLEEAEERYVAASVADWVLEESADGDLPDVDDVARYAIATIVAEVLASEPRRGIARSARRGCRCRWRTNCVMPPGCLQIGHS